VHHASSKPFAPIARLERLPLPDAQVFYAERVSYDDSPEVLLDRLIAETDWRSEAIVLWGRRYGQPRLTAWFGDPGAHYSYSGISLDPMPWTDTLRAIKCSVERLTGSVFNSVLANLYRDNRDSMGFHSDDEPELGDAIASASFGEQRTFVLRHKRRRDIEPVKLQLRSGSCLLMRGETQRYWQHGVPKERRPCGPRVNLTFRRILL